MIFVDTWAWLALAYGKDPYHGPATLQHKQFVRQGRTYVTSDYVLSEFFTTLFGVLHFDESRRFSEQLLQSFQKGKHRLVFVSPDQFQRAWDLRLRYRDKPDISFVDLTSMVVMQDLGVSEVFTGDAHFAQVNLGFRLRP